MVIWDQSQVNENLLEGQQDRNTFIGDGHKTTQNRPEISSREWSATGLTLGVTGVLAVVSGRPPVLPSV